MTHSTTTSKLHLHNLGIQNDCKVYHNLPYDQIAAHEQEYKEGTFTANGTFAVDTGKFTGRSPKDKFIVKQAPSDQHIGWGDVNQPTTPEVFDELYAKATEHYCQVDRMYVFDGYCGVNEQSRLKVRIVTELAWQHHFVTNMFVRPDFQELVSKPFSADFTIINACNIVDEDWQKHGLNSEVFVIFNLEKHVAVIGGTFYGGEMKKGIFSVMNYYLPLDGIMSMHASANIGPAGDTAIFFGLSGTGKTTLSADPKRYLIGDDEHGWDDHGVFNFEGGCYAKTIDLSAENEPDIFNAIKPDAMLENVWIDDKGVPNYYDHSKTENGRVSYPIYHIPNYQPESRGGHPNSVIFLTCDAYGVLPPVSRLSAGQASYYFLSGYTAKVAGTERGITEPQATFSACFGAAFMTLKATTYADLLKEKLKKHNTSVFLINTGWSGGAYGVGKRMKLSYTRKCVDAVLDGSIHKTTYHEDPIFGIQIPEKVEGVPEELLDPRNAWEDKEDYELTAHKLARAFRENFEQFVSDDHDVSEFGPRDFA